MTRIVRNVAFAISACAMCAISSPGFADVLQANDDHFMTAENTPLSTGVFENDIIPPTGSITGIIESNPADGTLSLIGFNNGAFIYTPNSNFVGTDMFMYRIEDVTTDQFSNTATVTIVVNQAIVSTTPLPALPMFATGLGALGLFGWRRKRNAQAVAA